MWPASYCCCQGPCVKLLFPYLALIGSVSKGIWSSEIASGSTVRKYIWGAWGTIRDASDPIQGDHVQVMNFAQSTIAPTHLQVLT